MANIHRNYSICSIFSISNQVWSRKSIKRLILRFELDVSSIGQLLDLLSESAKFR